MSPIITNQLASGFSELVKLSQKIHGNAAKSNGLPQVNLDFRLPDSLLRLDQQSVQSRVKAG
ncbi:MAG: hypothetical protein ACFB10_16250 [Salibacteraceae bacterium]